MSLFFLTILVSSRTSHRPNEMSLGSQQTRSYTWELSWFNQPMARSDEVESIQVIHGGGIWDHSRIWGSCPEGCRGKPETDTIRRQRSRLGPWARSRSRQRRWVDSLSGARSLSTALRWKPPQLSGSWHLSSAAGKIFPLLQLCPNWIETTPSRITSKPWPVDRPLCFGPNPCCPSYRWWWSDLGIRGSVLLLWLSSKNSSSRLNILESLLLSSALAAFTSSVLQNRETLEPVRQRRCWS